MSIQWGPLYTCGLTAVYYGVTCWLFALMPCPNQKERIISAAREEFERRFKNTKFKITNVSVEKYGYNPSLLLGAGFTNYYGQGRRMVHYKSGHLQSDVDARWGLNYTHLIVGTTTPAWTKGLWWRFEGGLSFGGGGVSANDGSDYTNLSPTGIQIDDPNARFSGHVGAGDGGLMFR